MHVHELLGSCDWESEKYVTKVIHEHSHINESAETDEGDIVASLHALYTMHDIHPLFCTFVP